MRILISFFLVIAFTLSCTKIDLVQNTPQELIIEKDYLLPSESDLNISLSRTRPIKSTKPPIVTTTSYKCIFMDFDGYTGILAAWQGGVSSTYTSSGLTATQITEVKDRVAFYFQDYSVTTTSDEAVYNASAINNRMRVIITTTSAWYQGVSGVSYIGSFTWGDNTPCFVFPDRLGFSSQFVGDIVAHEAGHTVGLYHQSDWDANCGLVNTYSFGKIMGYPFNVTNPLWVYGTTNISCTNYQSDQGLLTTRLGLR